MFLSNARLLGIMIAMLLGGFVMLVVLLFGQRCVSLAATFLWST